MTQLYIPIIGGMSAGKSNFLNAFLGIDVLQTGSSTTTKFVCLIKNCNHTSFYHVIPEKKNGCLVFNKEGNETRNSEDIKKKIISINKELDKKVNKNKNDIFFCLETPIKNKQICELLGKYIFMDIPGLNEDKENYIEEIFSLISLDNIFFEIMIFNTEEGFGGVAMIDIIKQLKNKNCLKKKNNLYILNKIDKRSNVENCIEEFKKFFYDHFQDNKKSIEVEINIYDNQFVPLSALLYQAEIKYKEDFYSYLMIFLFQYIKELTKEESFIDFLEKKIDNIIAQNEIDSDQIEEGIENLKQKDIEIIQKSIQNLKEIIKQVNRDSGFSLGINDEINEEIKKAYLIFELQLYKNYCYSEYYKTLEKAIKNIIDNNGDLPCPPSISYQKNDNNFFEDDILKEMIDFFKQKLETQFQTNSIELKVIRDNLYGNKIRIAFIGNISVGKSTILNCIIGQEILPTKEEDCTYRAIIIKHKDINDFYLYQTKEIEFGKGSKKYVNFVEDGKYYCKGVENVNAFLKTKNSDKDMNNKDTTLIIQGKLKIFNFIKLDKELIDKIEFIDLPGLNRKDGGSLGKNFYEKVLQYSNSCLYINLPTLKDKTNVQNIKNHYKEDKNNFSGNLRNEFLSSCLFLINKADEIQDEDEKTKISSYLIQILSEEETNVEKKINICFFSGKFFLRYLDEYKTYVEELEKNPFPVLLHLYEDFSDSWFNKTFNKFVIKKLDKIAENLTIKLNQKISIPTDFTNKLESAFNQLCQVKEINFSQKNKDEIIKKLYSLYYQIKNNDFSKTNYSRAFFDKLREIIIKLDNLQKRNLKLMVDSFFQGIDDFFKREAVEESKKQNLKNQKKYDVFKNKLIPKIDELLNKKKENLKKIIEKKKDECVKITDEEIKNADSRLKSANNDLEKASANLSEKMKKKIDEMKIECENEIKTIGEEIKKESEETIDSYFNSQDLSISNVEIFEFKNAFISLASGALGGVISGVGFYAGGAAIAAGLAAGTISLTTVTSFIGSFFGPIGIVGGLVVGGLIGGLVNYFRKTSKYVEALEYSKPKIRESFNDNEKCIIRDFDKFRQDLNIEMMKKLEIFYKKIEFSKEEWEKVKAEYKILRDKTAKKCKEKFNSYY